MGASLGLEVSLDVLTHGRHQRSGILYSINTMFIMQDSHACEYFLDLEPRGLSQAVTCLRYEDVVLLP